MIELKNNEFNRVIKILNKEKVHCTFAHAVVEGNQPGRIYVNDYISPICCLITCKSGKYLVAGDTNNTSFNEFLSNYLYNKENHSNYFDLYSSSHEWIIKLDEILSDNAAKLSRQLFQQRVYFKGAKFKKDTEISYEIAKKIAWFFHAIFI